MNFQREMRTDRQLWLICGAVMFVLLGFVNPLTLKGGESSAFWASLVAGLSGKPVAGGVWGFVAMLLCYAAILALIASVLGWVAQGAIVAARMDRKSTEQKPGPSN
ncbi:MAG TPA: hypothetical protein VM533_19905 [Fimbriiglobus sp.]|jgi:hypothetical protein|nr:hypothetical protein [Fimbriiglobus sp.]